MPGIDGYSFVGKREDFNNPNLKPQKYFATIGRLGTNKAALDTVAYGLYLVASDTVEATSTDAIVKLTGHAAKVGDVLRVKTTSNGIKELDFVIIETTANTVTLDGVASAVFAAGDTVDILRPVPQRFTADGASLASVISPPMQIEVVSGGVTTDTTVKDDLDTPANTVPVPVRLHGLSGQINVTAGDLDIHISHAGATPDSVQIGDGTTVLGITASNEAKVNDAGAITELQAIKVLDFATEVTQAALSAKFGTLGQKNMAGSAPVVIASDQAAIPISNISGTISLPTGAATSALQTSGNASLTTLAAVDYATQTTLSALNGKFSSLGQKATVNSAPVVLSTEQEAILTAIKTAVELIDNTVNVSNQLDVKLADLNGAATEATLAAASAKLPAALGQQNTAGSLSVVIASDHQLAQKYLNVLTFFQQKFAVDNVSDAVYLQIIADIGATAGKKVRIFYAGGEPIYFATGAAASEVNRFIIWPGMDAELELDIAANARISLKAVNASTTISSGILILNILG
jgi:hypothetical protein